ncbi:MAG: AMP-binding protein [Streptosporangiaceae bacterium]
MTDSPGTAAFRAARDLLLRCREDYDAAVAEFRWPELPEFNFGLDWFDVLAAEQPDTSALRVISEAGDVQLSYAQLAARSGQVANWLRGLGVRRGDPLLLMLGNIVPLWEVILASIKLGAVIIPASTLLGPVDLADRISRGAVRHVVTETALAGRFENLPGDWTRVAVDAGPGGAALPAGWHSYEEAFAAPAEFAPDGPARGADPLLLYFTSGTTAQPKLVEHTHVSYPAGHLSTMYWIGLRPGDVHCNISSPGWAKHAWSNVFAPWIAGAASLVLGHERFSAQALFGAIGSCQMTSLCAPPTVWRMLVQADLASADVSSLRECVGAGEPLNPEIIEQVRRAWGITVRDGYGQTETTAQIGNTPGQQVRLGSMGRVLPGYAVTLLDPLTDEPAAEGEICLDLARRPMGLMTGYQDDLARAADAMRGGYYRTGDVASRDADGYITYIGRTDDVFKASDYRISPFELESVLIEHEAVAEAAVVASPDPLRLAVPKAFVALAPGTPATADTALSILRYSRERLAPYKRIRRIEFAELPKTISGKIRRVQLRTAESSRQADGSGATGGAGSAGGQAGGRGVTEFWEEDFPGLKS